MCVNMSRTKAAGKNCIGAKHINTGTGKPIDNESTHHLSIDFKVSYKIDLVEVSKIMDKKQLHRAA